MFGPELFVSLFLPFCHPLPPTCVGGSRRTGEKQTNSTSSWVGINMRAMNQRCVLGLSIIGVIHFASDLVLGVF